MIRTRTTADWGKVKRNIVVGMLIGFFLWLIVLTSLIVISRTVHKYYYPQPVFHEGQ